MTPQYTVVVTETGYKVVSVGTQGPAGPPGLGAIGQAVAGGTAGSVLFISPTNVLAQDNANLFWDNTNKRLGIGTNTPSARLHVLVGTNSVVGSIVQGASGQTADLQQWKSFAGTVLGAFKANSSYFLANLVTTDGTKDFTFTAAPSGEPNFIASVGNAMVYGVRSNAAVQFGPLGWTSNGGIVNANDSQGLYRGTFQILFGDGGGQSLFKSGHVAFSAGRVATLIDTASTITTSDLLGVDNNGTRVLTVGSGGTGRALELDIQTATDIGLLIKGTTFQLGDLQQWRDVNSVLLTRVELDGTICTVAGISAGVISAPNGAVQKLMVNGNNTADNLAEAQINARAPTHKPLVVQGYTGQSANLQEWQAGNGSIGAFVRSDGLIQAITGFRSSIFQGNYFTDFNNNSVVLDTTNGGIGCLIYTRLGSTIPLVVMGHSGQSVDLQEWWDSSSHLLAKMTAAGSLGLFHTDDGAGNTEWLELGTQLTNGPFYQIIPNWSGTGTFKRLAVGVAASPTNPIANLCGLFADINNAYLYGIGNICLKAAGGDGSVTIPYLASIGGTAGASTVVLTVKGATFQTGNLQEWQNSSNVAMTAVQSDGSIRFNNPNNLGQYTTITQISSALYIGPLGAAIAIQGSAIVPTDGQYLFSQNVASGNLGQVDAGLVRPAVGVVKVTDGSTGFGSLALQALRVNNSAAATTPGTVTHKMQIFDAAGSSLGYVPIYDAIA